MDSDTNVQQGTMSPKMWRHMLNSLSTVSMTCNKFHGSTTTSLGFDNKVIKQRESLGKKTVQLMLLLLGSSQRYMICTISFNHFLEMDKV